MYFRTQLIINKSEFHNSGISYYLKKIPGYIFSQEFLVSAVFTLLLLALYFVLRAGFYLCNFSFYESEPAFEILLSFVYGIRYDLSALIMSNLPVIFLMNIPFDLRKFRSYRVIIFILFVIINSSAIAVNIADYAYYPAAQRRLLYEPYTMLPDILRMAPGLALEYIWLFSALVITGVLLAYISKKLYNWFTARINPGFTYLSGIISFLLCTVLCIIAIRGGTQMKPFRIANAFKSSSVSLGYLTLNTTFTVMHSYFQDKLPVLTLMNDSEADELLKEILNSKDETYIDHEYPFMRKKTPHAEMRKMNVVIFIMESWSANQVGCISGSTSRTPFFDSLASSGVLFTNFFSNGQRSIEGIPSILASLPAIYNVSIIGTVEETYRFRGIGSILHENGYTTSFHHGGITGTMGFDAFSSIAGFSNYYGKESFPNLKDEQTDGVWGICDEPFFLETEKVLSATKEPFCAAVFSLSSHDPFKIPENRLRLFEAYKDEPDFERSIRYSDFSLREFFASAAKEPWFANTLFVITCDHTMYTIRNNFVNTFHSPLLFYAPGLLNPQKISSPASQTDILPTILDILNVSAVHSSMGSSLLDTSNSKYVFLKFTPYYAVISDEYVLMSDLENQPKLFKYKSDPSLKNDLSSERKEIAAGLRQKLYAFLQKSTHAIGSNRIFK